MSRHMIIMAVFALACSYFVLAGFGSLTMAGIPRAVVSVRSDTKGQPSFLFRSAGKRNPISVHAIHVNRADEEAPPVCVVRLRREFFLPLPRKLPDRTDASAGEQGDGEPEQPSSDTTLLFSDWWRYGFVPEKFESPACAPLERGRFYVIQVSGAAQGKLWFHVTRSGRISTSRARQ
jgi:hypothetical protein